MSPEDVMCTDFVDLDIQPLDESCVRRAFCGSTRDAVIVHRSAAGVLYAACEYEMTRITTDADIKNGRWRTDTWDVSCSNAADIMDDWLRYGTGTARSLMDVIMSYVGRIKETSASIPEWHFRLEDTVVREGRRIPRILDTDATVILPLYD